MIIKGKTYKFVNGNDINTDLIIAGKYTKTLDMNELASHVFEDLDSSLLEVIKSKIIIAGENFGCGSSREQAPLALSYAGVKAVVAKSFARIFYRNAINIGLPVIIANTNLLNNDQEINIDLVQGILSFKETNDFIILNNMPTIMIDILNKGGLVKYLKDEGQFRI